MRIGSNAGHSTRTAAASGEAMQSAPTGHSDEDEDEDDADDDNTDREDAPRGAGANTGPLPDNEGVPDVVRGDGDGEVRADAPSAAAVEATLERAGEEEREEPAVLAIMAAADGDDDKEEADEDADAVELEARLEEGGGDAGRYERRAKCCASVKICAKKPRKTDRNEPVAATHSFIDQFHNRNGRTHRNRRPSR